MKSGKTLRLTLRGSIKQISWTSERNILSAGKSPAFVNASAYL